MNISIPSDSDWKSLAPEESHALLQVRKGMSLGYHTGGGRWAEMVIMGNVQKATELLRNFFNLQGNFLPTGEV